MATEGFGSRLLALRGGDGQWAGGAFFPWGPDPAVLRGRRTAEQLAENSRWEYDDLPFWDGEVDCCINAATRSHGAWLGVDVSANAAWFVTHQPPDGGWNCDGVEGARRSSVHSTINALGLLDHEVATRGTTGWPKPSRWLTLYGMRVLSWWDGATSHGQGHRIDHDLRRRLAREGGRPRRRRT